MFFLMLDPKLKNLYLMFLFIDLVEEGKAIVEECDFKT